MAVARLLVFLLIIASSSSVQAFRSTELDSLTFKTFADKYQLKFVDKADELNREALFVKELARVTAHNAAGKSWTETINKYSVMTKTEKQAMAFGRHKGVAQKKLTSAKTHTMVTTEGPLPANRDWRQAGIVSAVKDQGGCGSCWAFASTAVIESTVAKATGVLFDLSVQQITSCAPNAHQCGGTGNCFGATAELAFDYVAQTGGILEEYQYGYGAYYGAVLNCTMPVGGTLKAAIGGYVALATNDYASLINAVAFVGPIAVSVDASNWGAYESGVFDGCDQESPDINHAVVLVGYGTEADGQAYWLVRNSWSPLWGDKGYIKLARQVDGQQVCGTDVTPQDGSACEGQTQPVKVCGTCGVLYDSSYPVGARTL